MISVRPYKTAFSVEYALGELEKNRGLQFHPMLAGLFIKLIRNGEITPIVNSDDISCLPAEGYNEMLKVVNHVRDASTF